MAGLSKQEVPASQDIDAEALLARPVRAQALE